MPPTLSGGLGSLLLSSFVLVPLSFLVITSTRDGTYRGGSRSRSVIAIYFRSDLRLRSLSLSRLSIFSLSDVLLYFQSDLLLESRSLSSLPLLSIGSSDLLPERSTFRANLLLERPRYVSMSVCLYVFKLP